MPVRFIIDPALPRAHRPDHARLHLLRRILARHRDARPRAPGNRHGQRTRSRQHPVLHPARQPVADPRLGRAVHHHAGRDRLPERLGGRLGRSCPGAILLAYMFFGWFSTVIGESQHGIYNMQVDRSFRMGMMWFIFSEVMFFARLLRRAVLRAHAVGAVARRPGREGVHQLHPLAAATRRAGPPTARGTSAATPTAASAPSRRSASRRSTPRSCSPAASPSRSRTTRCAPASAAR